ncbi:MAG TPA: methyltransferase [Actinomycetes bacterium]|nr:methyltransferase [Actinomycetes bacterium]
MGGPDVSVCARLRAALLAAGYTVDGVTDLLGPAAYGALANGEVVPGLRATTGGSPLETLTRLFVLQTPVPDEAAAAALPVDDAAELGLLRSDGERTRAVVDVRPYGDEGHDWYVVSDLGIGVGGHRRPITPDHVLGVGGASTTLAQLTVRPQVERALDLGTGSGVQALHLTTHADHVVATDTNPRALRLAALTAGLSDVTYELRLGNLFEPVAGERFDLVVSNPPFVVGPTGRVAYRDAGLPGDDVCRLIVRSAGWHLEGGGWCQLLANWLHVRGQDWRDRVAGWIPDGVDAWVVQREVADPASYAALWLRDAGEHLTEDYAELYADWLDAFEALDAHAVGFGWVTLHAGDGRPGDLRVLEDLRQPVEQPVAAHVMGFFARQAWLRDLDITVHADGLDGDARLHATAYAVPDGVTLERLAVPAGGAWREIRTRLHQATGVCRSADVDDVCAAILAACDGATTMHDVLTSVAVAYGLAPGELLESAAPTVRGLVSDGFLEPVRMG